jgi:hypothetical protein
VEPIRIVRTLARLGGLGEGAPFAYAACFPDHFPVQGRAKPVKPGDVVEYMVPDTFDRPWARYWERHFEQRMMRPEEEDLFDFSQSVLVK